MSSKVIGVMAYVNDLNPVFSIANVVLSQIKQLQNEGHEVVLIATDDFHDWKSVPVGVSVLTLPRYHGPTEADKGDFASIVETALSMEDRLSKVLKGIDILITHDVIFLHYYITWNLALRGLAQSGKLDCKVLHWIHSIPLATRNPSEWEVCFDSFPSGNVNYITPMYANIQYLSKRFKVPEGLVKVVHNFVDTPDYLNLSDDTRRLWVDNRLWEKDVILVYAARDTEGKQIDKAIKFAECLDKCTPNGSVLLLCRSYSLNGQQTHSLRKSDSIIETLVLLQEWNKDAVPTSSVPYPMVKELYSIADTLIFPSFAEAQGLVIPEAAISGCNLILNEDLRVMSEFSGIKKSGIQSSAAYMLSFSSFERRISYVPSEDEWFEQHARMFYEALDNNPNWQARRLTRQRYSPQWVYKNQLEPLF